MIAKFHYLTQDLESISHQELAEIACKNGIRWIQLRVKNKPYEHWLQIAKDVKEICESYNAILIINDNIEIAKLVDADGVHLGKNDSSIIEAKKILGSNKIIGGTANTLEDIIELDQQAVNYIGLGPFRFTETKNNLAPTLGIEGYREIINATKTNIPLIAIGGIKLPDVNPLMRIGLYGIAVSSAINLSLKKEQTIQEFINLV